MARLDSGFGSPRLRRSGSGWRARARVAHVLLVLAPAGLAAMESMVEEWTVGADEDFPSYIVPIVGEA